MRAGTNAAIAGIRARADRTDMRAAINTVTANPRASADNIAGMTAGIDAVITDTGACANRTDMRAGTDTMASDMRANAHAKNTDAPAHIGNGRGRSEQDEREE
jgi:hypothetical protein